LLFDSKDRDEELQKPSGSQMDDIKHMLTVPNQANSPDIKDTSSAISSLLAKYIS